MEYIGLFKGEARVTAGYLVYYLRGKDRGKESIQAGGTRGKTELLFHQDDGASVAANMVNIREAQAGSKPRFRGLNRRNTKVFYGTDTWAQLRRGCC